MLIIVFVTVGYLLGTIPTGMLIARWRGVDIRRSGSGNIGATNVLRSVGPLAALVVVLIDPLKGVIAVGVPTLLGLDPWIVSATAIATVLGNTFNMFLGFRGGKGIATSLGVFLVVDPLVTVLATALFALTLWLTRFVSLASLLAVTGALLMLLARLDADPNVVATAPKLTTALVLVLLAFVRHRENVARLRAGAERRLGEPREPAPATTVATTGAAATAAAADRAERDDVSEEPPRG
ncbi:MAG: glycerol-3-phosphate 1-O-acyltransferase [Trueperaceae bacterium]|nr:MAG: glycerol-3-phosphate 1-O-acyltransferase [Trueperaceae bacterium]